MERNYILLMGLFLLLVAVDFSSSDPEGNVIQETGLDKKVDVTVDPVTGNNVSNAVSDSNGVNKVKENGGDQVNILEKRIQSHASKSKLNQQSGSNEGENLHKDGNEAGAEAKGKMVGEKNGENVDKGQEGSDVNAKGNRDGEKDDQNMDKGQERANVELKGKTEDDNVHKDDGKSNVETKGNMGSEKGDTVKGDEASIIEPKGKKDGEKKEFLGDSLDPKEVTEENNNARDSVPPPPPKDGIRGEECDPSNMCMDKNERFAACLRVPGDDFLDLSLLIQNMGKGPLTIKISAPAFVHLEETEVELHGKQDKKVKVSIKYSGTENFIVLKDGSGECSLDFKDFMVHKSAKAYVNILSQTPTTTVIFVMAILILASGWICVSVMRRRVAKSGLKHQRVEELPVSCSVKTEPDVNNGWDNSWGDNWDDEEAPMTPSVPVTPRFSSKGLASRRLSKEGWKD